MQPRSRLRLILVPCWMLCLAFEGGDAMMDFLEDEDLDVYGGEMDMSGPESLLWLF
eukprot:gene14254-16386_t